jgi:membrane-associated protease RseP (regulator of RpoE activity)
MRERFVCVRITGLNGVNLRRFEFDYDVTWNAFFLDEDLNVYSRYGGRDEGEPEDRLSKQSLLQTMREVLDVHAQRESLRSSGAVYVQPVPDESSTPEDIPLLRQNHQGCVHCHQVREYQLLQWSQDGEFAREKLFRWPLPESLGIEIDRGHGHRIEQVEERSAAARAGLIAGDIIEQIDDVPIHSEYDIRWALDRAHESLSVRVRRAVADGDPESLDLSVSPEADWKQTDLSWRKSLRSVPLPFGFRGYSLTPSQRRMEGLSSDQLAIKVISLQPRSLAENLRMQNGDIVLGLEEQSASRTLEQFKSDLLRRYRPGDTVRLTVRRNGTAVELTGPFPDWYTPETSVP